MQYEDISFTQVADTLLLHTEIMDVPHIQYHCMRQNEIKGLKDGMALKVSFSHTLNIGTRKHTCVMAPTCHCEHQSVQTECLKLDPLAGLIKHSFLQTQWIRGKLNCLIGAVLRHLS